MRRAALIYNPRSGRQRHAKVLAAILATLRAGGFEVEPIPTDHPGHATELAREKGREVEVVFVFGGDGTMREAAAGLLGSPAALGLIPGGTANVLGLALGLPRDPVAAAAALTTLPARPFDVGLAGESPFLMLVSAGLDATVVEALDIRTKWRFGRAAFVAQGVREWWRYPFPTLRLVADGERMEATLAVVSNIPFYGGSLRLAPGARFNDGWLDLVLFRGIGRAATLSFTWDLIRSVHVRRRDVTLKRVREVLFEGPAGAPVQVDGDLCPERLPLAVQLSPERLSVLAPEES
jgi:diacylglycerol kinase (ATP)